MAKLTKYYRITMEESDWPIFIPTKSKLVDYAEITSNYFKTIEEQEQQEQTEIDVPRLKQVMFDLNRIVRMLNSVAKNGEENENNKKD